MKGEEFPAEYRATHSRDGYALGSPQYPDNRAGRRAMARTWKRVPLAQTSVGRVHRVSGTVGSQSRTDV